MENDIFCEIRSLEKIIAKSLIPDNIQKIESSIKSNSSVPTPTQMQIISYILVNCDKEIHQRDLEHILGLSRATVSGVLQTMEKNGLVIRNTYLDDSRTKTIVLTDSAKNVYLENQKRIKLLKENIINNISKDDLDTFFKVLNIMKCNLNKKI